MSDIVDENSEISNINLDTEMRQSYLDYAMSGINHIENPLVWSVM